MDWQEILAWLLASLLLLPVSLVLRADVPPEADRWKNAVTEAVQAHHGPDGPVALHAAMIHQESRWRPSARSSVGAEGIAQIMPTTAEHIAHLLGQERFDPYDPRQAIQGMARYTAWLRDQIEADDPWPMVVAAYNGGVKWLERDREAARAVGADPDQWWGEVEDVQTRGDAAHRKNREYVRRVVLECQEQYLQNGWQGPGVY